MTDQSLRSGAVFRQFLVLRSGAICKEKKMSLFGFMTARPAYVKHIEDVESNYS